MIKISGQCQREITIANERQIDLGAELQNRFAVDRPEDLSIRQASELIDALKQINQDGILPTVTGQSQTGIQTAISEQP